MTDDQSIVVTLIGLFWLLPLLLGIIIGRFVSSRTALSTVGALLLVLLLGAAWAYFSNQNRGYGPEFALYAYLMFVSAPVFGFSAIGLFIGQVWRRKAIGASAQVPHK